MIKNVLCVTLEIVYNRFVYLMLGYISILIV